jgi:hypothetical protein
MIHILLLVAACGLTILVFRKKWADKTLRCLNGDGFLAIKFLPLE